MLGVSNLYKFGIYDLYEFGIYELSDPKKDISDLCTLLFLSESGTRKEQWWTLKEAEKGSCLVLFHSWILLYF